MVPRVARNGLVGGLAVFLLAPPAGPVGSSRTLWVGPGGGHETISAALAASRPFDTIRVAPGLYRERLVVRHPVVLLASRGAVIDGGGEGHVIEALAAVTIRGFEIRGSGTAVDREDAGIMVRGAPARIEDNRLEDVFFGIYLKDAPGSLVRNNRVLGKPLPVPRRGDGIRLWYSGRSRILGNEVVGTRDVVVYFSDSLMVADNAVRSGRYGLHYMYSHHNRFERNRFEENEVGAFLMYSRDIRLRNNVFADFRGRTGMGIGLKDADGIRAEENLLLGNAVGLYLDNSPTSRDSENRFLGNVFAGNGTGVRLLPSVRGNRFQENAFVENDRPVEVEGGTARGQVEQNRWERNYWSSYAGFDADGDGVGDTRYVYARLADQLVSRHPELRLFALSPALRLVNALGRFFPLLQPEPAVVDPSPLLRPPAALARWRARHLPGSRVTGSASGPGLFGWWLWPALSVTALALLWRGTRRPDGLRRSGRHSGDALPRRALP